MEEDKKKFVTFRQNPNIDFLFGYFKGMEIPTKQDAYKPNDVVEIDENGAETILKEFYQRKPEKASIQNFKNFIKELTADRFKEKDRIKMPDKVQVSLSFSIKEKRFFEVDVDNLSKTVLDSLNGIAFDDDRQVTSLIVDKHIHKMKVNGILIAITKLTEKRKGLQYKWDE
ncbi:RusA family crossover junction endodeoxyribonuclease [Psychroflexus montanilacus]|uniref:RusA family crossover junction endodeoxyribonuclease n=1 Tax=Psychroflexus montanilacus TaxID=2873598 RepID=UPI001CCC3CB4|nr:RusA family crossover junction endodeoxyribonuclease [Psychroflexus montanilacus]MBZ9650864.1 RusA family crossover junction endodeoxyribonuclease [Psychroflexus montanilacus]